MLLIGGLLKTKAVKQIQKCVCQMPLSDFEITGLIYLYIYKTKEQRT